MSAYYDPDGWRIWRVRQEAGSQALLTGGFNVSLGAGPQSPTALRAE